MANWILVNSHRRSGTHLLIDALQINSNATFPAHRNLPVDFNIGSLFRKDEAVYEVFRAFLSDASPIIIKSHLLPEEMQLARPKDKFEQLIKEIYETSSKLYIHRDGKDTLVSLYNFLGQPGTFESFLESPNDHFSPSRRASKIDGNRVHYWAYHVQAWSNVEDVQTITFESLIRDFGESMRKLLGELDLEPKPHLERPALPKHKNLHKLRLKLKKWGLVPYPYSSSVSPREGKVGRAAHLFSERAKLFFDEECALATD